MKSMLTTAAAFAIALIPVGVQAQDGEGKRLTEATFESIAGSSRGWIDQGGFQNAGRDVFAAMDADEDLKVTLKEFLTFDVGMKAVAEKAGRLDAHDTAMRVVHAFWDRDGDGVVSKSEHSRSLTYDFQRADVDDNARLTLEEFTSGFTVMVALRAAINPAPVD